MQFLEHLLKLGLEFVISCEVDLICGVVPHELIFVRLCLADLELDLLALLCLESDFLFQLT